MFRQFEAGVKLPNSESLRTCYVHCRTIFDIKEKIKAGARASAPLSAMKLTRHKSDVMVNMERLLNVWIHSSDSHSLW